MSPFYYFNPQQNQNQQGPQQPNPFAHQSPPYSPYTPTVDQTALYFTTPGLPESHSHQHSHRPSEEDLFHAAEPEYITYNHHPEFDQKQLVSSPTTQQNEEFWAIQHQSNTATTNTNNNSISVNTEYTTTTTTTNTPNNTASDFDYHSEYTATTTSAPTSAHTSVSSAASTAAYEQQQEWISAFDQPTPDMYLQPTGFAPPPPASLPEGAMSMEKRYQCPTCHKYFRRDLPRHLRTHETVARFTCPFSRDRCPHKRGQFNRPYDFKKHLLHGHFTFDEQKKVRGFRNLQSKLDYWGTCGCGERFKAGDWLDNHVLGGDRRCGLLVRLAKDGLCRSRNRSC